MTIVEDVIIAIGDERDRRRATARARAAGVHEAPEPRCAHCSHCAHCEECPFRLDLGRASKPIARLVLERIDKYYNLMVIMPVVFVILAKEGGMKFVILTSLGMALFALIFSLILKAVGVQKVWPKAVDVFNVLLFAALVPVAYLKTQLLSTWLGVIVNAATFLFMALSVLAGRPYIQDIARDHVPATSWQLPYFKRSVAYSSLAVAAGLFVATWAALVPALMCPKARWQHAEEEDECPRWAGALFDYVLQIVPIIGGLIAVDVIAHRAKWRHTYDTLLDAYTGKLQPGGHGGCAHGRGVGGGSGGGCSGAGEEAAADAKVAVAEP